MAQPPRPRLLGHRGARGVRSIPENTLESFDRALADGCDGFEFDVRLTADGVPVVCHDPRFGGIEIATAGASQVSRLPRLQDVLARYQERAFLDIELKVTGIERLTLKLLRKYPPLRGFVISSFLPEVLRAIGREGAGMPLGFICDKKAELPRWKEVSVEYVIPHQKLVSASVMRELKHAKKKVLVWTVNRAAEMRSLGSLGVDGIISDHAALLCQTFSASDR